MNKKLQVYQVIFGKLGILPVIEYSRYVFKSIRLASKNRMFRKNYPDFVLPPKHLLFDAQGHVEWERYRHTGNVAATHIVSTLIDKQIEHKSILEWGCGPGRVIRHLQEKLPDSEISGSDYNIESVSWCQENIQGVNVKLNSLHPPLDFNDNKFDFIFAISVFTHLSENVALEWISELTRVTKPGGYWMIWTNGDQFVEYLLPEEKEQYDAGKYVTRSNYKEGKKMFLSCQSPAWIRDNYFKGLDVIEHLPGGFTGHHQDIWLVRKPL